MTKEELTNHTKNILDRVQKEDHSGEYFLSELWVKLGIYIDDIIPSEYKEFFHDWQSLKGFIDFEGPRISKEDAEEIIEHFLKTGKIKDKYYPDEWE